MKRFQSEIQDMKIYIESMNNKSDQCEDNFKTSRQSCLQRPATQRHRKTDLTAAR